MVFESFAEGLSFLLWTSFVLAVVLGAVANKTNFCTMGAVSDVVNIGDYGRFRAWILAIAVAMLGVTLLEYLGAVNVSETFPPYRASQLILGENILGGLLFGIGMTLGSGCGNKTLIRLGGGNLKSLVVFVVISAIAYYMTNPFPDSDKTLFSVLFYDWIRPLSINLAGSQDIGAIINPEEPGMMRLVSGLIVAVLLLFYVFKSSDFRSHSNNILAGVIIGLAVLGFWYTSSNIAVIADDNPTTLSSFYEEWDMLSEDEEGKPEQGRTLASQSFTFINPIGQTLGYVKSGFTASALTAGILTVFGVIFGSFLWALFGKSFRFEWFLNMKDFVTHLIGATLMGFGGVLALGCTIGQGITGFSTLATGSILAFISIVFGSALTMKIQYYKLVYENEASFIKALLSALVDMKLLPSFLRKLDAV